MDTTVLVASSSFLIGVLVLLIWQVAQIDILQQAAQKFARNRELKLGLVLFALAPISILVDIMHGTWVDPGIIEPIAGTYITAFGEIGVVITQFLWVIAIGLLSLYVHLMLIAAYTDYDDYPPIDEEYTGAQAWNFYRRWTYLFRTRYKSVFFISTPIVLLALFGYQIQTPALLCVVLGGYHAGIVMLGSHGSKRIDYRKEKRLLSTPDESQRQTDTGRN